MHNLARPRMTVIVRQCCSVLSGLEILKCRAGRQGGGGQGAREARLLIPCNVGVSALKAPMCQASTVMALQRKYAKGSLGQAGDSRSRGQLICKSKQSTCNGVGKCSQISASVVRRLITSRAALLYMYNHLPANSLSNSNEC